VWYNSRAISVVQFSCNKCPLLSHTVRTFEEHKSAYAQIYRDAGVTSCKKTHDRTIAVQNLGQFIANPFQISSLTKHIVNSKLSSAYQAEADRETSAVQAGFEKVEEWFVPEANLELPCAINQLEDHLLPELKNWRNQSKGRYGDKSPCCKNFLEETIPFLVEVVVQCGVFFIKDFPGHPFSELLKQFPGYELWAASAREQCKVMLETRLPRQIDQLNAEARGAFQRLSSRIDGLQQQVATLVAQNEKLVDALTQVIDRGEPRQEQPQPQPQPPQPQPQPQPQQPRPQQQQFSNFFRQANDGRKPVMSRNLPSSFATVVYEWRVNDLESFRHATSKSKCWGTELAQRFSKRMFLIDTLSKKHESQTLEEAAKNEDDKRAAHEKEQSVAQVFKLWKKNGQETGEVATRPSRVGRPIPGRRLGQQPQQPIPPRRPPQQRRPQQVPPRPQRPPPPSPPPRPPSRQPVEQQIDYTRGLRAATSHLEREIHVRHNREIQAERSRRSTILLEQQPDIGYAPAILDVIESTSFREWRGRVDQRRNNEIREVREVAMMRFAGR
jgi:hypothetical protein